LVWRNGGSNPLKRLCGKKHDYPAELLLKAPTDAKPAARYRQYPPTAEATRDAAGNVYRVSERYCNGGETRSEVSTG